MVGKKIVDDYYSQINDKENTQKNSNTSKPKIRPKKIVKKVVKKIENNEEQKKSSNVSDWKKSFKSTKRQVVKKLDINVDKKDINKKTDTKKKRVVQKITVVRKADIQPKKRHFWVSEKSLNKNRIQNFWEDKQKVSSKNNKKKYDKKNSDDTKKNKNQRNKTRWRFRFYEEEQKNTGFVRSNKVEKSKKEEKKVEDINQVLTIKTWETIKIGDVFSLKEFSEKIWVPLVKLIAEFMKNGMMVNINSKIDFESATIIAESFDIKLEKDDSEWMNVEDLMTWNINDLLKEDDSSKLEERPPVISIMWHVDHWKTSLLDRIRKSKITQGEAWWITQSIGAYQVEHNWKKITLELIMSDVV